jgi:hypothetical protein
MSDQNDNTELSKPSSDSLSLNAGQLSSLNLEGLPEETKLELRKKHAEGLIDLQAKAIESGLDTQAIDKRMGDIANNVAKATADQSAATVTGAYTDKLGRTEVIMGNTETAQKGKLTGSQKGQSDSTLLYVALIIGAVILLALILN